MTSPSQFLRAAGQQFSSLVNRTISALQVKRRAQVVAVALVSLLVAALVSSAVLATRHAQHQWASHRRVVVVTASLAIGDELSSKNTRLVDVPLAVLPVNVVTEIHTGDTARIALQRNTAVTEAMITPAKESVHIPTGWRVIALPNDMPAPPLHLNDVVDVVGGEEIVAAGVIVASLQPLTIAVPADVAATVASVVHMGEASLVSTR